MNNTFHTLKAQKKRSQENYAVKAELILCGILPSDPPFEIPKGIVESNRIPCHIPDFEWAAPVKRSPQNWTVQELEELLALAEPLSQDGYLPLYVLTLLRQRIDALSEKTRL